MGETADVLEGLRGQLVALVQLLHDQIRVVQEAVGLLLGQAEKTAHLPGKGQVEDRVVQGLLPRVVLQDAHRAQPGQLREQRLHHAGGLDVQPHLEVLLARAVLLGAHVADVDAVAAEHLQHGNQRAGAICQLALPQHHLGVGHGLGQKARLRQLPLDGLLSVVIGLHVHEKGVHVHCLVVAGAGDVAPVAQDDPAGLQERPGLVRHGGHIAFLHV